MKHIKTYENLNEEDFKIMTKDEMAGMVKPRAQNTERYVFLHKLIPKLKVGQSVSISQEKLPDSTARSHLYKSLELRAFLEVKASGDKAFTIITCLREVPVDFLVSVTKKIKLIKEQKKRQEKALNPQKRKDKDAKKDGDIDPSIIF